MWIVALAWVYVVLMMAIAEALSTQGTVLGAVFTFLLYGLMPLSIVLYVMGTPHRRRAARAAEAQAAAAAAETPDSSADRDSRREPPGQAIAPKGEEP